MKTINNIMVHPFIELPETLVLVRHAQSVGNVITSDERAQRIESNQQFCLTAAGIEQAKAAGAWLKRAYGKKFFDICFHSSLKRTQQTLEIILKDTLVGDYMVEDSRLDEKWDGIFHDLTREEIERHYPEQTRLRSRAGYYHYRSPGGENCPDVEGKARSFFSDLARLKKNKVLICCHGSWLLVLRRLLEAWPIEQFAAIRTIEAAPNCGIYIYTRTGEPGNYTYNLQFVHPTVPEKIKTEFA